MALARQCGNLRSLCSFFAVFTFWSLLDNLQMVPDDRLGEGLLLCKTLQREKLSTRF